MAEIRVAKKIKFLTIIESDANVNGKRELRTALRRSIVESMANVNWVERYQKKMVTKTAKAMAISEVANKTNSNDP